MKPRCFNCNIELDHPVLIRGKYMCGGCEKIFLNLLQQDTGFKDITFKGEKINWGKDD